MVHTRLEDEIRARFPALARRADGGRSPVSAWRIQCLACMGLNNAEVRGCEDRGCPGHPYRMGKMGKSSTLLDSSNNHPEGA